MLTVAIVGRPNVGKSALFNRLAGRRISIVHDQPGVTRDRIAAPVAGLPFPAELIDTGGIGEDADTEFTTPVFAEAGLAIETADLILFVVDLRTGLTPVDQSLAQILRRSNRPVEVILNKADDPSLDHSGGEFASLGFGPGLPVSAEHGRNSTQLLQLIEDHLRPRAEHEAQQAQETQRAGLKIAVVGRPNAGKSSLINAILDDDRTIVSDIAGTTRDAVDIPYQRDHERHLLIDTAGLRPRSRMDHSVEVFSAMRTERSIRRADICLLVVDIAAGITAQDRKIARIIQKANKPCLLVANKYDLFFPEGSRSARLEEAREHLRSELFFLDYAPYVCVSSLKKQSLGLIFDTIGRVRREASTPPGTGQLNRLLQEALLRNPPPLHKNYKKRLKLFYATILISEHYQMIPVPEYLLFVNDKRLLSENYRHYLEHCIRADYPSSGLPVNFRVRSRRDLKAQG